MNRREREKKENGRKKNGMRTRKKTRHKGRGK
jgi:hypothetical protein